MADDVSRCAEVLLNIKQKEESPENTEQPLDLSLASGYQDMSSASQPRNTERVNIQDSDNDANEDIAVLNPEQENEESVENTELPLDLSIATNRSQPPSGSQEIYSASSASQPRNAERVNIQGSDRDSSTTLSEYYFTSSGSHLPTYQENIQSQTPSRRAGNVQVVGNSATHRSHDRPSATPNVRSTPYFSQINQVLDQRTLSLNQNLHSAVRDNASSRNFTNMFSPDIFMVPFQLNFPNMHQHYVLPSQQAFTLPTYNQNICPPNFQTNTQTDNFQFYASYYTSAENQSRCNLLGLFTQPTHPHISQNLLSNQQADEIHSTPSTSQDLPTDVFALALPYYSPETRKYECPYCRFKTDIDTYIVCHIETHDQTNVQVCSVCDYRTKNKSVFERHMKIHDTGNKPS